jgi:two-component system, LuxR family, response regulator FixJ
MFAGTTCSQGGTEVIVDDSRIYIVDDDDAVRDSLVALFESLGYRAEAYASGPEFLDAYTPDRPACLILDLRMPRMSGLAVQEALAARRASVPIVVLSGYGEVPIAVRAMKSGAIDFVVKPFSEQDLLDRTRAALERARIEFEQERERTRFKTRLARLTPREREVMLHVVQGKANKVIASDLRISQKTVEVHRYHLMHKMGAASAVDLARLAGRFSGVLRGD